MHYWLSSASGGQYISGYCFIHWIAFARIVAYYPKIVIFWTLIESFLTALFIAWLSGVQMGAHVLGDGQGGEIKIWLQLMQPYQ
jgi:hypothetical protein